MGPGRATAAGSQHGSLEVRGGPTGSTSIGAKRLRSIGFFAACQSTALEPVVCAMPSGISECNAASVPAAGDDALARYDDNRNGAITCKEARRHGIAPVLRSHPAYRYMRDGDGDGVVCE